MQKLELKYMFLTYPQIREMAEEGCKNIEQKISEKLLEENEKLRTALKLVRFFYNEWNPETYLPLDWPRNAAAMPLTCKQIIDEALK